MAGEHTPGPWRLADHTVWALDETGQCNRFSALMQGGYVRHRNGWDSYERTSSTELEANARLISAAPELLEALEELVAARGSTPFDIVGKCPATGHDLNREGMAAVKARAAIAKARGAA